MAFLSALGGIAKNLMTAAAPMLLDKLVSSFAPTSVAVPNTIGASQPQRVPKTLGTTVLDYSREYIMPQLAQFAQQSVLPYAQQRARDLLSTGVHYLTQSIKDNTPSVYSNPVFQDLLSRADNLLGKRNATSDISEYEPLQRRTRNYEM